MLQLAGTDLFIDLTRLDIDWLDVIFTWLDVDWLDADRFLAHFA